MEPTPGEIVSSEIPSTSEGVNSPFSQEAEAAEKIPTGKSPQPSAGRLVVTGTVYHQRGDDQPSSSEWRFSRRLTTGEQSYVRDLTVPAGERWVKLDTGWLGAGVGYLTVRCLGPGSVELGVVEDVPPPEKDRDMWSPPLIPESPRSFAVVRAGEDCRFEPSKAALLRLRCHESPARIIVTAIPN